MTTHAHGSRPGGEPTAAGRHRSRLMWALALTTGFLVLEGVGSLWTGSLALLADAGHMLTDKEALSMHKYIQIAAFAVLPAVGNLIRECGPKPSKYSEKC